MMSRGLYTLDDDKINYKHSWSKYDNFVVSLGYLLCISPHYLHYILYYIPLKSINMKYKNCLYLDKGNVTGSLSHVSNDHKKIWTFIKSYMYIMIISILIIIRLIF